MMGIRQAAAEKLARKLLELRAPRLEKPTSKFYEMMARVIMVYVDMDEQRQRSEEIMKDPPEQSAAVNTEEGKK